MLLSRTNNSEKVMDSEITDTIIIDEKDNKDKKAPLGYRPTPSLLWPIYILISVLVFFMVLVRVSSVSSVYDKEKSTDLMYVVAEKMDAEISSIAGSVRNSANMLGASTITDMYVLYHELQATLINSDYTGIGLINPHGHIYATISEQEEIVKWNFTELAIESDSVKISHPYRSGRDGKMVMTFFKSIYKEDQYLGSLFVTYPLEVIAKGAKSELLTNDADIYIVNPQSENYVVISSDKYATGEWSNMKLVREKIVNEEGSNYDEWNDAMLDDTVSDETYFLVENISYAQVFHKIEAMDGWDVVVRMQYAGKSGVAKLYKEVIIVMGFYFLFISLFIFSATHVTSKKR